MEVRFHVSNGMIEALQERTHAACASEIGRDAMSTYDWVTEQVGAGRQIFAIDESGNSVAWQTPLLRDVKYYQ